MPGRARLTACNRGPVRRPAAADLAAPVAHSVCGYDIIPALRKGNATFSDDDPELEFNIAVLLGCEFFHSIAGASPNTRSASIACFMRT